MNYKEEVVFPKGKKYTLKMLNAVDDYTSLNPGGMDD